MRMTNGTQDAPTSAYAESTADTVRAIIARSVVGANPGVAMAIPERLGSIRLKPHQLAAAVRLQQLIDDSGGALLADEVGLGKTYVALAVAHDAQRLVVVAPAGLRSMWYAALERVRRNATFVSFERLSRGEQGVARMIPVDPDFVIVDEAHHVRTPSTQRYAALAQLCARSRVLLMSATPLQNRRRDVAAQLALFLGAAASTMSDSELTRYVVRRTRVDVRDGDLTSPVVAAPEWIDLPADDGCLEQILALPPPLPASDGGDGGALLVYTLVRRWASSRAALRATLRRRIARATALTSALETGRYPPRAELAAWTYADATVQLAFPELITPAIDVPTRSTESPAMADLLASVRAHERAVEEMLRVLDTTPDPDLARTTALRAIRARHPGERVIAFAESAETVDALFRHLRADAGVAMLTARGARVSGGAISRREALARFAPVAQGAKPPHASQRVDFLLTTDLLSEGVNLQDASVVVHLDLPWNPARLEQRVGRVCRLGSSHERVAVYAMRPPAAAERLLAVEQRLRAKLATAGHALGIVGTILPGLDVVSPTERGAAEEWTRIHSQLGAWRQTKRTSPVPTGDVQVAAVRSATPGFLAAIIDGTHASLVASLGGAEPSTEPGDVARAIDLAGGAEVEIDRRALARALAIAHAWRSRRAAAELSGVDLATVARARRRVLARIDRVGLRSPRHARPTVMALAADARRAALMRLGEGAERVLAELADAPLADQAWLRAVAAFGEVHARRGSSETGGSHSERLAALLLLQCFAPLDAIPTPPAHDGLSTHREDCVSESVDEGVNCSGDGKIPASAPVDRQRNTDDRMDDDQPGCSDRKRPARRCERQMPQTPARRHEQRSE
jgi:superfamily II DNA or RNA helicase